jgi:hypothetical protein
VDRRFRVARVWSNRKLRQFAPLFGGEVVNVAGGQDIDKEGSHYREYFTRAARYSLTNIHPGTLRGFQGRDDEMMLDLAGDVPPQLCRRFDVAFNHTTLEHIFEARRAFANICELSRDIVIIVAPFCQVQHHQSDYGDFWRFTPGCIRALFAENGCEVLHEDANNDFNAAVYLFFIASRDAARWRPRLPPYVPIGVAGQWIGAPVETPAPLSRLRSLFGRGPRTPHPHRIVAE